MDQALVVEVPVWSNHKLHRANFRRYCDMKDAAISAAAPHSYKIKLRKRRMIRKIPLDEVKLRLLQRNAVLMYDRLEKRVSVEYQDERASTDHGATCAEPRT